MYPTQAPSRQRYRIAEVGRLTGFAPTTLRFYESVGVLAPPERTAAGYRLYGDRDVERLRLIARAIRRPGTRRRRRRPCATPKEPVPVEVTVRP